MVNAEITWKQRDNLLCSLSAAAVIILKSIFGCVIIVLCLLFP